MFEVTKMLSKLCYFISALILGILLKMYSKISDLQSDPVVNTERFSILCAFTTLFTRRLKVRGRFNNIYKTPTPDSQLPHL